MISPEMVLYIHEKSHIDQAKRILAESFTILSWSAFGEMSGQSDSCPDVKGFRNDLSGCVYPVNQQHRQPHQSFSNTKSTQKSHRILPPDYIILSEADQTTTQGSILHASAPPLQFCNCKVTQFHSPFQRRAETWNATQGTVGKRRVLKK